jgi:anti-sigma factor RsiW
MNQADEQAWLMSLALDGQLDDADAARLEALIEADADLAADWQVWQRLDEEFHRAPSYAPPVDFAAKFETRLAQWERRRKLRVGVIFGLAALALWISAFAGVFALGAFFWANQVVWLGNAIHYLAFWWASVRQVMTSLFSGMDVLLDAPQTWVAFLCYLCLSVGILASWFVWLRRSLQPGSPVSE